MKNRILVGWSLVIFFAMSVSTVRAVDPEPHTLPVGFSYKISPSGFAVLQFNDGQAPGLWHAYGDGPESDVGTGWMKPGKQYTLDFSAASGVSDYWISLTAPSGYQFYVSTTQGIEGTPKDHIRVTGKSGDYSDTYYVQIRPSLAEGIIPAGSYSGINIGQAVTWELGLGRTRAGLSAGLVKFRELDFTNNPADRARLVYVPPAMGDQWNLIPSGPSDWTIRQIVSPRTMVDFVDETVSGVPGYWVRYYNFDDTTYVDSSWPPIYTINSGKTPWRTIRVESPASNQLRIIEKENETGATEQVSLLTLTSGSVTSGTYVWTLLEGGPSNAWLRKTVHTSTKSGGVRENVVQVYTMSGATEVALVSETKYIYHTYAWGEDLYQVIANPNGGSNALTTTYDYYTNAPSSGSETYRGSYRRVKSVAKPGGGWTAYEYYDDWERRGQIEHQFEPYLDSPSSPNFNTALGRVKTFDYVDDTSGRYRRPSSVLEKIDNVMTAKTTWTYDNSSDAPNLQRIKADVKTYFGSGTNDYVTTHTERIDPMTGDIHQSGAPYMVENPDGTQISWSRSRGNYSSSTFTVASTTGEFWRILKIHGTSESGTANGAEASTQSSYDGQSFAPIYLVPDKSTMEITILDYAGGPLLTETRVYLGSGNWSDGIGTVVSEYDFERTNRLESSTASNGATTTYAYDVNGRVDEITGGDGVVTEYTYDALGRTETVTKIGVSSSGIHAAQTDVTTTYTYDGANRVTTETVSASGETSIVSAKAYDKSGRVTSVTPPGLSATTYTYNTAARTQTVTAPDTGTTVTETHRDGRIKSVTGTAVVPKHYSYVVETNGQQRTQLYTGYSGSPRWKKTWTDLSGRLIKTETPGFLQSSQAAFIEEQIYDGTTGQLIKKTRTGYAPTLYEYNALGQLFRSGYDIDAGSGYDDELDPESMDRVTDVDTVYEYVSSVWWLKQTSTTYPDDNDDTHPITTVARTRLTGFTGGLRSETESIDAEGNTTVSTTSISGKLITTQTSVDGLTASDAYAYVYNGRESAATGHDGLTTKLAYDNLGRLSTQTDPRSNVTTTTYYAGTAMTYQVKDDTNTVVTTNYYDSTGRLIRQTDALGFGTRYAYNTRGQVTNQWGDGSYPIANTYDPNYGDRTQLHTYRSAPTGDSATWPAVGTADTTTFYYDEPSGIMWKKQDADSKAVVMDFNSRGLLAKRTLARGSGSLYTTYTYNSTGELTLTDHSDTTPDVEYDYTRMGQVKEVADATGTWDYVYDSAKPWRLSAVGLPAFYGTRTQTLLYENTGFVGRYKGFQLGSTAGSSADLEQTYTYSSDGRFDTLKTRRDNNNTSYDRTFDYSYLANTPFVSGYTITGNTYFSVTRAYESDRDLLQSIDTQWTTSLVRYDYTHDDRYQRQTAKQSGSAFSDYYTGSYSATWNHYTYNPRGELQTAVMYGGNTPSATPSPSAELPGRRFEYRHDSIGNRTTAGPTGSTGGVDEEYETNNLNQYVKRENNTVRVLGIVDNSAANVAVAGVFSTGRKDKAWGADLIPDNFTHAVKGTATAYAAIPGAGAGGFDLIHTDSKDYFVPKWEQTFGYDEDGNMTHDSVWNYEYDAENRLISMEHRAEVIDNDGMIPSAEARKLVFVYDYQGRRVRKTVYGGWNGSTYTGSALSDTKYLYDGWNLIAEFNASTLAITRSYTWGLDLTGSLTASGGVGALVQVYDASANKTLLPAYDGNGNVAAMINAGSGALEAIYEYDPFGNLLRKEGSYAASNPFRFSTKYADVETGLVYYGHRYYSPDLGRFINRDPIEEQGGVNLYSFVRNNAVNAWDYLGMVKLESTIVWERGDPDYGTNRTGWSSANTVVAGGGIGMGTTIGTSVVMQVGVITITFGATSIDYNRSNSSPNSADSFDNLQNGNAETHISGEGAGVLDSSSPTVDSRFDPNLYGFTIVTDGDGMLAYSEMSGMMVPELVYGDRINTDPNSALQQAQATAAQLGWNGFTTNLSESQQLYYGKTAADILALQAQGKDMSRQWQQVISEVPGVITDSGGLMMSSGADAARSNFLKATVVAGATGVALGAIISSRVPNAIMPELNSASMQATLAQNGWTVAGSGTSTNGAFVRMQSGSTSITFYTSTSGGGVPTAQVFQNGTPTLKIRLGPSTPPAPNNNGNGTP